MADSFLPEENPFNEEYFEQYSQQVGDNRIAPIMDELKEMSDPEDMMLLIMDTLKDTEVVPDAGQYYTFIYTAKTPRLTYDQHPLVAVTDIQRWGFRGINYHWGKFRNYTWEELGGVLYVVRPSEINDLRDISYAYFLTTL